MTPSALAKLLDEPLPKGVEGRSAAGEDPVKRHQILEGARRIFVSVGFDAASMNDITREAGVSKSTLYVYFRSKEELFTALISDVRERYFAEVEAMLGDVDHPAETLKRFGLRLAEMILSPEAMHAKRTVIAVAGRMPHLGREFYQHGPARGHALVANYLERARDAGTLAIDDIALAAHQFIELTTAGMLRRRFFDDEAPAVTQDETAVVVDAAVRLFMAGYGARGVTVWRPPQAVRVKALGLLIENDSLFAFDVLADTGSVKGVRPLGGTIEFGESRAVALRREFREELQTDIEITGPFACFENLYVHEGAMGHEIVFLAPVRLVGRSIARDAVVDFKEADGTRCRARWHELEALRHGEPALYPSGLAEHLFRP